MRPFLAVALTSCILLAQPVDRITDRITDRISVDSLRGHVSFLASDVLQGRGTPSRGLDFAAQYIAAEFQRAGLAAAAGGNYFQTADFTEVIDHPGTQRFIINSGGNNSGESRDVPAARITVTSLHGADLASEPVFKWAPGVSVGGSLAGKILVLRAPPESATVRKLAFAQPDAIVELDRVEQAAEVPRLPRLVPADRNIASGPSVIDIPGEELEAIFERLPNGLTKARASLHIDAPDTRPAKLGNVAGILRGSDPVLRDQYILISAHYDHLGVSADAKAVYSGANDNASGVATVIELAHAFARENPHPKRTLVFLCFFGEEEGLLGSQYYVRHPLYPLADTIADINFEQLGRPEKSEGLREGSLGVTGSEFSSLPQMLARAAKPAGVVLKQTREENEFFDRSDNYAFALAGIPAHTFLAAFDYPDYHQTSDKWPKLDYDNMARLDRALALGILDLATRPDTPKWNESNPKAKDFAVAWRALHR